LLPVVFIDILQSVVKQPSPSFRNGTQTTVVGVLSVLAARALCLLPRNAELCLLLQPSHTQGSARCGRGGRGLIGVQKRTGLNHLPGAKFQRFLSGKSVFLNSKFQIREFHAH